MKKGIASQVFIYIFIVVVIALVLVFGFKQIVNLNNLKEKSIYVVFKEDFKSAVNDIYYKNKGSTMVFSFDSRNKPLELPKGINNVCFQEDKVVLNSLKYNDFNVDYLYNDNICIKILNRRLSFKLENMGDFVSVSET